MCSGCWWNGIPGHLNGAVKSEVWIDGAAGLHNQSAYKAGAGWECTAGAHLSPLPQEPCSKGSEMRKQSGGGEGGSRRRDRGRWRGWGGSGLVRRDKQGCGTPHLPLCSSFEERELLLWFVLEEVTGRTTYSGKAPRISVSLWDQESQRSRVTQVKGHTSQGSYRSKAV